MNKRFFSPSLMCANMFDFLNQLEILENNKFDFFHLDIMDLNFVPNLALNFDTVNLLNKYNTPKDIHLMVKDVPLALKNLKVRPGDYISFHVEASDSIDEVINFIKGMGANPGLVINPSTDLSRLYPYFSKVKLIHVMTVEPGFAGQPFIDYSYDRVKMLKAKIQESGNDIIIGVDGGIGFEQIEKFNICGANLFVLGTTCLFRGDNFNNQVSNFIKFKDNLKDWGSL